MAKTITELFQSFHHIIQSVSALPYTMIFESHGPVYSNSRYSYVAFSPVKVMTSKQGKTTLVNEGVIEYESTENPYKLLESQVECTEDEFGWAGFMSYESCRFFSDYSFVNGADFPDLCFATFKHVVVFDRTLNTVHLHSDDCEDGLTLLTAEKKPSNFHCEASMPAITHDAYVKAIADIKESIASGDVYQINFTYPISCKYEGDAFVVYERLNEESPMPYSSFIRTPETCVVSNSPELFIAQDHGKLYTKPLKGTMPRGRTVAEDKANLELLSTSEKDKAELLMIVDLERNDLNKICKKGSVAVSSLFEIERYNYVFQQSATVSGELKTDSLYEKLSALFPGGSITGAPKIRAMELIKGLESGPRRLYTGSVGFISKNHMSLNIAIRTLYTVDGSMVYHVGGGIVTDSDPDNEWLETKIKGCAIKKTLQHYTREKMSG
jgi:para-aminobenzoate synthetase component I